MPTVRMYTDHVTDWFIRGTRYSMLHVNMRSSNATDSHIINEYLPAWYHEPKLLLVSTEKYSYQSSTSIILQTD